MKTNPSVIGLVGSVFMIAALLAGYYEIITNAATAQLIAYGFYTAAVAATLLLHGSFAKGFGGNFSTGFRCFIVVTLILVIFTFVFNALHPETAEQAALSYRESLLKVNNRTPDEIAQEVKLFKEGFATMVVSRSIFGYLMYGAITTAIGSFLQTLRKS